MSRLLTPVLMCTGAEKENEEERLDNQPKLPWEGSDRDYTYQELLGTYAGSTDHCMSAAARYIMHCKKCSHVRRC